MPDMDPIVPQIAALLALGVSAVTFIRQASGRSGERQIEPTQIARIETALERTSSAMSAVQREIGEVAAVLARVEADLREMREKHSHDYAAVHRRIDALERTVAGLDARMLARA